MTPLQKRLDEHWRGYLSGDSVYSYADLIRDVKSAAEEIARLTEALAAERERCAKIAERHAYLWPAASKEIAQAIRTQGGS